MLSKCISDFFSKTIANLFCLSHFEILLYLLCGFRFPWIKCRLITLLSHLCIIFLFVLRPSKVQWWKHTHNPLPINYQDEQKEHFRPELVNSTHKAFLLSLIWPRWLTDSTLVCSLRRWKKRWEQKLST